MAIQQGTVTITGFVGSMPVPFGRSGESRDARFGWAARGGTGMAEPVNGATCRPHGLP